MTNENLIEIDIKVIKKKRQIFKFSCNNEKCKNKK